MGLMSPRVMARRTVIVESPSSFAASPILNASRAGLVVAFPEAEFGFICWMGGCNGIDGRFVFCLWLLRPRHTPIGDGNRFLARKADLARRKLAKCEKKSVNINLLIFNCATGGISVKVNT